MQPMKLVCMDVTKYAQAYVTKNKTAKTTAKVLFGNFVVHYGFPKRLHSDQGRNFESQTIKELCQLAGIQKSRTTLYHPMGNGIAERLNSTLLNMMGTLEPVKKLDWKSHIGPFFGARLQLYQTGYNTTGYAPYFLMFGRHPRIIVDLVLGRQWEAVTQSVGS